MHVGIVDGVGVLGVGGGEISGGEFVEELVVKHGDSYANVAGNEAVGLEGIRRGGGDKMKVGDVFGRATKESVSWGYFDGVLRGDEVL
ncbi:unnamed protein product [Malus baccata var. baccata]